ncbi:DEAD/DEAH box helicase [Plantibacter sp. YIM 135249]|uniref:DEAD/DEAH box helicase n=1 Tax=Plantibacter sp. YIM 135249 TaxID=3423918 RepID=UPI003D34222B
MPKNKNSAGGRPAKNFDPRYGENKKPYAARTGGPQAGSKSPSHRGYRAEDANAPKKSRWNADERADRAARTDASDGGSRYDRNDRPSSGGYQGRNDRNDRPSTGGYQGRNERPAYNRGGDDRPARSYDRPATGGYQGRNDRNDRPATGGYQGRNERPAYNRGGDDRPARSYDRPATGGYQGRNDRNDRPSTGGYQGRSNDRPAYNRGGDDRPARSYDRPATGGYQGRNDRNDRPATGGYQGRNERPAYNRGGDDRPARSYDRPATGGYQGRDDRPARSNDRPSYGRDASNSDRPARSYDRPATGGYQGRDDRPARSNDRPSYGRPSTGSGTGADRPARSYGGDPRQANRTDRAAGSYEDRPKRSYDDRPARSYDDRPKRSFDDRPARSFDGAGAGNGRSSDFYPKKDDGARFVPQDDVVLERLEADAIEAKDVEGVTFESLGLGGNIVRALEELGAASPFPIQAATIPDVIAGRDVLGRGRTGSGKTIAFGAPLVEKLMENGGGKNRKPGRKPRALILAPTRELALQIDRTVQPIARAVGLFTTQIYGGVPQGRQVGALQRGVDIIVGTPGRIEDLIEQGRLDLSQVTVTVLDEADHMCDLGFLEPVQRILRRTAPDGQKLLFSATLDKGVATLVKEFLPNPSVHEVAGEDQASSTIDHRVLVVEHKGKDLLIEQLVDRSEKTLVFARTRAYADRLTEQLEDAGIPAVSLHGDLNQARRTRNLEKLTSGRVNVLVATDVAARGIHVDDITLVVQADAPDEYKTYLHRAGRTGRAGKVGRVVTIIPRARQRRMTELLDRAEIEASFVNAAPGDAVVGEISASAV